MQQHSFLAGLYPAVCFTGSKYETVRGRSSGRRPRVETQCDERGRGLGRGVLSRDGSPAVSPGKILKFETQSGAIWCILARN